MLDLRIGLALATGLGAGALAALSALHASTSAAEAAALGAAAVAVGAVAYAALLWLDAIRPPRAGGALVVFCLFAALGLMLAPGGHAG